MTPPIPVPSLRVMRPVMRPSAANNDTAHRLMSIPTIKVRTERGNAMSNPPHTLC
jgi:hypothetical protein